MGDQRQKYRSVLLDDYCAEENFRQERIEVIVGENRLEVLVRALPMSQFNNPYVPDDLIDKVGQQEAVKLTLVTKCARTPDGDRIYNPPKSEDDPGDVFQLLDGPMYGNGPIERMFRVVNYVHGFTPEPPGDIQDHRLDEIAEAADHLAGIAEAAEAEGEEMNAAEIKDLAELIGSRVRYIDHGTTRGK